VGRFAASSQSLGATKQYVLGMMTPALLYQFMEKSYALVSRGASISARKLGPTSVEVVARPNPGVAEKPYQCANRTGIFEALSQWFTAELALIDHPECFHRGDPRCRYIVTWQESGSHRWRRIRNMMIALATTACAGAMVFLPFSAWGILALGLASLVFACSWQSERLKSRWLTDTVANQKKAAEETLLESEVRYNNALLVQEIGQATSTILDIDNLIAAVMGIIEKRLDFDRGAHADQRGKNIPTPPPAMATARPRRTFFEPLCST
jgi:hypothetical protein